MRDYLPPPPLTSLPIDAQLYPSTLNCSSRLPIDAPTAPVHSSHLPYTPTRFFPLMDLVTSSLYVFCPTTTIRHPLATHRHYAYT
jgi:hypothetical protein